ncbi:HtrA protease/chaperone protein OS=Myxococcus stipitatus (strain DSM 14675 / JCM 12634 / Mx s8) GN=MYSTI_02778 PE=4 SV=1 [Gemmata massiliana]|uniref:HtrA protease/chaperone protein n=1 Tax=Gemmata massiliana TaxID=1210884 RepID=A0A6P2DCS8_9BACT|nr:hypothetical protein [Gemmata massiliana]VTR98187.1 HtrA protease/chaperone protein OS=Myxococcus stipitatus (strain DSM 14675 / JCM 12634 / Mx s8) GN=MYSTI_02778 PE=4 SV=1 [Gemmata massiliana]
MASFDDEAPDPLGPARPLLVAANRLAARAAGTGDFAGSYALLACAVRLTRRVRGLSEVADFRLERATDEAENESAPEAQNEALRDAIEALLGDAESPDEALPTDPLAAAQTLIGRAIAIGAPAYNTGDHQGCFDVYSCTARIVLATVAQLPEPASAQLRDALAKCRELSDSDAQAWAMRHAFDAIGELGGAGGDITPRQVLALISMAISIGAPAFNAGDHRGCYEVYACTARLLVNSPAAPNNVKTTLRTALTDASTVLNVTRQAWIMREALDGLLGAEAEERGP